jgi:ABC-2 type transport system ATP-binding protein
MSGSLISLRDVGVRFSRNKLRHRSVRELLTKGTTGTRSDEFWPFRHLNLDIERGEAIGVVGRNGQGKSTLLRLIAGVLLPDEGTVQVQAGVAPLIAITGGFESELSARENIYLVSGLHGMNRAEIDLAFHEIVDFAEIGEFLDTPYKHFSTGMKMRLAFSVVSRLQEPILLVDEVLAVGDKAFRKKCHRRIDALLETGQTLFLVSHSAGQLMRFCTRGIYLEGGGIRADGPIADVIAKYEIDTDTVDDPVNPIDDDIDPAE